MHEQKPGWKEDTSLTNIWGAGQEAETQQAQKTEYGNVHCNRKEANVAGAESAGEKGGGIEVRKVAKDKIRSSKNIKKLLNFILNVGSTKN